MPRAIVVLEGENGHIYGIQGVVRWWEVEQRVTNVDELMAYPRYTSREIDVRCDVTFVNPQIATVQGDFDDLWDNDAKPYSNGALPAPRLP